MPKHELTICEVFEHLVKISETGSRNDKDALMKKMAHSKVAHAFFVLAMDRRTNLWVSAPDVENLYFKGRKTDVDYDRRWSNFRVLFKQLGNREMTGSAAVKAVHDFLSSCSNEAPTLEATWYAGALNRHLNIGVSTATVKKIWDDIVDEYDVQLAASLYEQKTMRMDPLIKKLIKLPCVQEPKLDGINTSLVRIKVSDAISRSNFSFPAVKRWVDAFDAAVRWLAAKGAIPADFVVNGEFKAERHKDDPKNWKSSWGKTNALLHSGIGAEGFDERSIDAYSKRCIDRDLTYTIYNCYSAEAYKTGVWNVPYGPVETKGTRSWICNLIVKAMLKKDPMLKVRFIEQAICKTGADIKANNERFVAEGHEGSMLKNLQSGAWLGEKYRDDGHFIKLKQYKLVDVIILGVTRGTNKYKNTGGAIVVYIPEDDTVAKCACRGEAMRDWAWKNRKRIGGFKMEIVADGADAEVAVVRNPIIHRIRTDVAPITLSKVLAICKKHDVAKKYKIDLPDAQVDVVAFNKVVSSFNLVEE